MKDGIIISKSQENQYFAQFPGFYTLFKVQKEYPKTFEDYLDMI